VPGGNPVRYLAARFKGSDDADAWPCRGEATLRLPLRAVAPFVGDGEAEELRPGLCRVRLGSWSWGALAASFARFEVVAEDVEPAELRAAFAELARRSARSARGQNRASGL